MATLTPRTFVRSLCARPQRSYKDDRRRRHHMYGIKGMVQVGGHTFRIERVDRFLYEVVRISDDRRVGSFCTSPLLSVVTSDEDPAVVQEVARAAIQNAKTSWAKRL